MPEDEAWRIVCTSPAMWSERVVKISLKHLGSVMLDTSNMHICVICWSPPNHQFSEPFSRGFQQLGCKVTDLAWNARLPDNVDVVVVVGPLGSLVPMAKQIIARPISRRPSLVYCMTEQLPNPDLPEWLRYGVGQIRSRAERLTYRQRDGGEWQSIHWLSRLTTRLHRFGYYGDLYWLKGQEALSVLITSSTWTAEFLRARGFDPMATPITYDPDDGEDLGLERDIDVLWIGKIGSARRARLLKQIQADLAVRGIEILMIDGEENPYVFGDERTVLINRTKIVLNIVRKEWDDNSMRFKFAASNGAMIVTEPLLPHSQFKSGVHLIEADMGKMADTICYYLSHEEERKQIAENAYQLLTEHSGLDILTEALNKSVVKGSVPTDSRSENKTAFSS